jgi:hypothetical protein
MDTLRFDYRPRPNRTGRGFESRRMRHHSGGEGHWYVPRGTSGAIETLLDFVRSGDEVVLVPVAGAVALGAADGEGHRCGGAGPPLRRSPAGKWPLGGNRKPRGLDDPPWDEAHGHHDNMPVSGELFHAV